MVKRSVWVSNGDSAHQIFFDETVLEDSVEDVEDRGISTCEDCLSCKSGIELEKALILANREEEEGK